MTDHEIPRDRWGRPLIAPVGGGKPSAYIRTSTLGGCLEDTTTLTMWQCRNVALGLADNADLLASVRTFRADRNVLNGLVGRAQEAAGSKDKAQYGTDIHSYCETIDSLRGVGTDAALNLEAVTTAIAGAPPGMGADLWAYYEATTDHPLVIAECFTVQDELKVAGTPDAIRKSPDGAYRIYDIKTGNIKYGMLKIAIQMAVYAHSVLYDWETETRSPYPVPVDQEWGVIIHVPAGEGRAELVEVDLKKGWEAAQLAKKVHGSRSLKNLSRPFQSNVVPAQEEGAA